MAVIEYDDYKQKLLALEPTLGSRRKRSRTASGTIWSAARR